MTRQTKTPPRQSKKSHLPEESPAGGPPARAEQDEPPEGPKKISDTNLPHLLNLAFKLGDWLHTLWNYYFVIVIAIVGWILTKAPVWNPWQKGVFCAVFALASAVNWILIGYNFRLLKKVLRAAEKEFEAGPFFETAELNDHLGSFSTRVRWIPFLYFFHAALDLFVLILILDLTP